MLTFRVNLISSFLRLVSTLQRNTTKLQPCNQKGVLWNSFVRVGMGTFKTQGLMIFHLSRLSDISCTLGTEIIADTFIHQWHFPTIYDFDRWKFYPWIKSFHPWWYFNFSCFCVKILCIIFSNDSFVTDVHSHYAFFQVLSENMTNENSIHVSKDHTGREEGIRKNQNTV